MQQLIEKLSEHPIIILVLLSWPLFLWFANFIITKLVMKQFKCKVK
jgi:hypothetical protein